MENITMTIDATQTSRVRSACPQVGRVLLASTRGWVQGTTVPADTVPADRVPASVIADAQAPTYVVGGFGATNELEFRPFGEPPV
jgi:hypothetical protein